MPNAWESAPLVNSDQPAWASAPLVNGQNVPRGTSQGIIHSNGANYGRMTPQNEQPGPDVLHQVVRAGGLAGRAMLEGVPSLGLLAGDVAMGPYIRSERDQGRTQISPSQAYSELLTLGGAPTPETSGEQLASAAIRGGAGAVGSMGAGSMATSPAVRTFLTANPALQTVSGVTGATGGEIARQQGAGAGGQLAATMAAGTFPAIISAGGPALIKWMLRGGEEGRQAAADVVDTFAQAGTVPTVGQATGSRIYQGTEGLLSRVPGGAGPVVRKAEQLQSDLANKVDDMANSLAPKANPEQAGRLIEKGITGKNAANPGDSFMVKSRVTQKALYDKLDTYIPQDKSVAATHTQAALARLTAPIKGAENLSETPLLSNQTLNSVDAAMTADTSGTAASSSAILQANGQPFVVPGQPATNALPYQALKEIRTRIGEKLSDLDLAPDVPKAQLKQLYGALSQDMEQAAKDAGPEAYKAFQRANGYTSALHDRIDLLQSVIDKNGGPEKIFMAATSGTKDGATVLRGVMKSLPEEGQKMLSASILRRMGKALPGAQNATGDVFSTERFLTAWNTMSPEAKQAAFGRYGMDFNKNMNALASIASNLRQGSKVFANPSGTAQVVSQQAAWYTIMGSILTGHPLLAGTEIGLIGQANLAAKALTSPKIVQWMVKTTEKPIGALPAQINQLAEWAKNQNDPEAAAIAEALKQAQQDNKASQKPQGRQNE